MADIQVGANRDELDTIAAAHDTAANTADPTRLPSGGVGRAKDGTYTGTGNASLTAFVVTHGAGFTPGRVLLSPKSAAAAPAHWWSTPTATEFTINFAAAPAAAANNIVMDYLVIK